MDRENRRRRRLNRLIYQYNERELWKPPELKSNEITEMFEIGSIESDFVQLRFFFEQRSLGPVFVPPAIRMLLRPDDLFLLTIVRAGDCWHISFMSTLYETCNIDEEAAAEWH